jgi:hypothetical protein
MVVGVANVVEPVSGVRLTDVISLGVLAEVVGRDAIEDVLDATGRREQRTRRLPAHVVVRLCLAMCLFYDDDYEEVTRKLVGSLREMGSWRDEWTIPTTSAVTQARKRLTDKPMKELFDRTAKPVSGRATTGAWCGPRLLMAVDAFMLDVPDTKANVEEFGRLDTGDKASAFPQVRVLTLDECGSHASIAASFGPCRVDERTLLKDILGAFGPNMLIMADRNFYSFHLWQQALNTGADLLWRVTSTVTLPVLESLSDGSYRSVVINPKVSGARRSKLLDQLRHGETVSSEWAIPVRVIEYEIPDRAGNGTGELVCLVTSILDPSEVTAIELAAAYHERWENETGYREKKPTSAAPGEYCGLNHQ